MATDYYKKWQAKYKKILSMVENSKKLVTLNELKPMVDRVVSTSANIHGENHSVVIDLIKTFYNKRKELEIKENNKNKARNTDENESTNS